MEIHKVPALWKYDKELGIAFFCSSCKRFICSSGKCKCGAVVDLDSKKESKPYIGKVKW